MNRASDIGGKLYPALPSEQYRQVKSVVEDVMNILNDDWIGLICHLCCCRSSGS